MKKLLIFILILASAYSYGQRITPIGTTKDTVEVKNAFTVDSLLTVKNLTVLGLDTTNYKIGVVDANGKFRKMVWPTFGSSGSDTLKLAFAGTGERPFWGTNDTLHGKTIKGLGSVSITSGADSTINVQLTGFTTGRIPFSSSSSVLTDNANLKWDATGSTLVIGGSSGSFTQNIYTTGNSVSGNFGNSGGQRNFLGGGTFTDNTTAASGSKSYWFADQISGPTYAATNSSVTYNNISTLTAVAPTAGTNITATHRFAIRTFDNSAGSGSLFVDGGSFLGGGVYQKLISITSNYTITSSDYQILVDATGGNITLTLPAVSSVYDATLGVGIIYSIKRIDASGNTVTVQRAGSDLIDNATSFTLTSLQSKSLQAASGGNWWIY
jgi:hypothetical protein